MAPLIERVIVRHHEAHAARIDVLADLVELAGTQRTPGDAALRRPTPRARRRP